MESLPFDLIELIFHTSENHEFLIFNKKLLEIKKFNIDFIKDLRDTFYKNLIIEKFSNTYSRIIHNLGLIKFVKYNFNIHNNNFINFLKEYFYADSHSAKVKLEYNSPIFYYRSQYGLTVRLTIDSVITKLIKENYSFIFN